MSENLCFYKFRPINKKLIESLVQQTIFASKPIDLNDPFDCRVDLKNVLDRAILRAKDAQLDFLDNFRNKNFIENWNNVISSVGIYSFSLQDDEILSETLMWSHYADEHKGVCLKYILSESFIRKLINDKENNLMVGNQVDYEDNGFDDSILTFPLITDDFTKELLCKYVLTKNKSWSYEKEGRLIFKKSGTIKLPGKCLNQVYFGLQSTASDQELIITLAKNYSDCNDFYKTIRGDGDHKFQFEKIIT